MSLELMEAVWQIEFTDPDSYVGRPTLKLVMLALAHHANDEGDVLEVPRVQLMAEASIRGKSYWGSAIRVLEEAHWLDRVSARGPGNYSSYLLDASRLRHVADVYSELRRVS